jgi:carboxymethylenebutenolidase
MPQQTAQDFHPEALKIFDQYVHGDISRRDFLSSVPKYALLKLNK